LRKIKLRQDLELEHVHAESLASLDKEKNKFFSNISHEFRTPLTLILGPLDSLIADSIQEKEKEKLNLVQRNARRLQTLINQLLSLSKLESGNLKLKARPENIVKLSRLLLESFHSLAEDRGIHIDFESDAEEYIVYIDKLKFEKIVNNLLSNAFKFTEKGGKIRVSVTPHDPPLKGGLRGVKLMFADTGIGIREERLQHVFDRFYQVDEQQKKSDLGTGIGLALTKELVELHHGEIKVESKFGMGTTFTVFLPLGKDHLAEDEVIEAATTEDDLDDEMLQEGQIFVPDAVTKMVPGETAIPEENGQPLLLIVEDNADMRAYIKSYLVDDYQVMEASNGKEGAEMAIQYLPDLIVSDLMMPFVDGNEMTQQLKHDERTSHIPIILLTAKAGTESKIEGLETGADDFLTKPFDAKELLVRIKNLIEQRRKLQQLLSKHIGDNKETRIIRESSGKAMSKLDERFLEKAKALVDDHLSDTAFTTEKFASQMAMSRTQLHRKLKGLTNLSASDFVRDIRLNKAAALLKEGELNITQVSYEIGISSLSYFSKTFKEKFGVNPSEYSS
jgi:DNA-binding response OmpR family regulator/nitrogen-specific signal transduction histidine kinase